MSVVLLTIAEPVTVVTDFLMAALAAWFAFELGKGARWWSLAFALLAASSMAGGVFHGFQGSLARWIAGLLWRSSLALAGVSSFATMRAGALQWLSARRVATWTMLAALKLSVALVAGALWPIFLVVVIDFALSILFVMGAGVAGRARNPAAFRALLAATVLFVAGAAVQQGQLRLHASFNHNDLFHTIQIVANSLFFLSARLGSSVQGQLTT